MDYDIQQTLDSGIELLTTDLSPVMDDGVEAAQHFRTEEPVTIELGETAGHQVTVEAQHFVAAAVDREPDAQEVMMGMAEEGERVVEASVFISNEEAEIGGGLDQIPDADLDDALRTFEQDYLDYQRDDDWQSGAGGFGDGPEVVAEEPEAANDDVRGEATSESLDESSDTEAVGIGAPAADE